METKIIPGESITVEIEGDDGLVTLYDLPGKWEICDNCDGHGTHMNESMRTHGYSREEFDEAFTDDEDREAYFKRGGKYDVACQPCNRSGKVWVVNEEALKGQNRDLYDLWQKERDADERYEREYAASVRMEQMMGA